jgi:hypothetical protein
MTTKKKPNLKPTKCKHVIDSGFPSEEVVGTQANFPNIYRVGRCWRCYCIVALLKGEK